MGRLRSLTTSGVVALGCLAALLYSAQWSLAGTRARLAAGHGADTLAPVHRGQSARDATAPAVWEPGARQPDDLVVLDVSNPWQPIAVGQLPVVARAVHA